jgi:hypothetical protein
MKNHLTAQREIIGGILNRALNEYLLAYDLFRNYEGGLPVGGGFEIEALAYRMNALRTSLSRDFVGEADSSPLPHSSDEAVQIVMTGLKALGLEPRPDRFTGEQVGSHGFAVRTLGLRASDGTDAVQAFGYSILRRMSQPRFFAAYYERDGNAWTREPSVVVHFYR